MKIVFIAIKGVNVIGGIETYTVELGKRLVRDGHEVITYCIKTPECNERFIHEGIEVIPLPTVQHKYFAKMMLVMFASMHQLSIKNVDVVHYHAVGPSIFSFIPRIFGRYTVFQSHGHEWKRKGWNNLARLFFRMSEKMVFWFVNDSTSVSMDLQSYYKSMYKKMVAYIPTGINPVQRVKADKILEYGLKGNDYILFVGRFSEEKRIHDLLGAYQKLDTDIKLVIVGSEQFGGCYSDRLFAMSEKNNNIIFPGSARGRFLSEWYSNAFVYVLPSETEGLPITLLEAMSYGKCCIASRIPANMEVLGDKGILFDVGDIEGLFNKIKFTIENPAETEDRGRKLKFHVLKNYQWDDIAEQFVAFYNKSLLYVNEP